MRADLVLGFDPAPADPRSVVAVGDGVRRAVRALTAARDQLDRLGRAGSVWEGPAGAPVVDLLRRLSSRFFVLEEALIGCLQAVDRWHMLAGDHQERVADLVAAVADLAGDDDGGERRTRLLDAARELAAEHERGARDLAVAFEGLSATVERLRAGEDDLAGDLHRALAALEAAVEQWIEDEAAELLRTVAALGEVAALTTVISEIVGLASLQRRPGEAAGVSQIVARSPSSHRLIRALRQQWVEQAPIALPESTFAASRSSGLTGAVSGRLSRGLDDGGADSSGSKR